MTEYRFRYLNRLTNEFVYSNDANLSMVSFWDDGQFDSVPGSLGQWTGKEDSNGVSMYDGDKINFTVFDYNGSDTQYSGIISWDDVEMSWCIKNGDDDFFGSDHYSLGWIFQQDDNIEVFGNIHQKENEKHAERL